MSRLRVLEMIDKSGLGGGQAVLLALARGLDPSLFDVAVAAQAGGPLEEEARRMGLPFRPMPFGRKRSGSLTASISEALRVDPPDILHTHGGIAGFYGRRAARRAGVRAVVHTIHGIHYLHYRNPLLRAAYAVLERRLSRSTGAVVLVSEADLATARRRKLAPEAKLRLVRNGVDVSSLGGENFARRAEEIRMRLKFSPPLIGTVARLHRQKGVVHLLRAAPAILARHPAARIVVAGGGELESEIRVLARGLRLGRHIVLLGERPDARELLSLFNVFVLPSLWEGLPLVLIEAAALGKPIVATDVDGSREILSNGETGLLVPAADPPALASAVNRLLDDPDLASRLASRAKETIPSRYSLEAMIAAYADLYLSLSA